MTNFLDELVAIGRRMAYNAGTILVDAAKQMGNGDDLVKPVTQLYDTAFHGFMEYVEAVSRPQAQETVTSDDVVISADSSDRQLTLASPLTRIGSVEKISDDCVVIDPPVLPAGAEIFRLVVRKSGYPSGAYACEVRAADMTIPVNVLL